MYGELHHLEVQNNKQLFANIFFIIPFFNARFFALDHRNFSLYYIIILFILSWNEKIIINK